MNHRGLKIMRINHSAFPEFGCGMRDETGAGIKLQWPASIGYPTKAVCGAIELDRSHCFLLQF